MDQLPALPPLKTLVRERPVQVALALALLVRLAMATVPSLPHFTDDSSGYIDPGVNLFTHASYATTCDPRCIPTLFRTPGYPVLLGLLLGVFKLPLAVVYVLQALFDTGTTLLVAALGWAMGGRRIAVAAALVHALNPFSAVFAGEIMTESLITLALTSAVYLLWRIWTREKPAGPRVWLAFGALLGLLVLIRPVLAPVGGVFALSLFDPARWRAQLRAWTLAFVGLGLVLAPWVARNWVVSRDGGADDSFQPLGSFSSPFYRRLMSPGLMRWYATFEEPFVWDRPREAPIVAKYFLPGEKERVEKLFEGIRAADVMVTPELDVGFAALAHERIAAHPFRTVVLPPLTRMARLWITPRLSSFGIESARLEGVKGKLLFLGATAYNALFALVGFGTGFLLVRRRVGARLLLAVPVFLTLIHPFLMWGNQSRYSVPGFPFLAVLVACGGFAIYDRVLARVRNRAASRGAHTSAE